MVEQFVDCFEGNIKSARGRRGEYYLSAFDWIDHGGRRLWIGRDQTSMAAIGGAGILGIKKIPKKARRRRSTHNG